MNIESNAVVAGAARAPAASRADSVTLPTFTTAVITDDLAFAELTSQWEELVDGCALATPFQTHAWLSSWWRAYGKVGRLRVVVVYAGDRLVAAAPLYLRRRWPVCTIAPVGAGISDFSDVLVADELGDARTDALHALVGALRAVRGWDVIDLPEVPPGAAAHDVATVWPGRLSQTDAAFCLELATQDLQELLGKLSKSTRKKKQQALRRIERAGVTTRVVPLPEVPDALENFHRLHEAQWAGRGINPEHVRTRFRNFLAEALPMMVARQQAVLTESRLDGELMSVLIYVMSPTLLGGYLAGVSPELRGHVDVNTLQMRDDMILAAQLGVPTLSLLRGAEETKMRWQAAARTTRNARVVLGRPGSVLAVAYLGAAEGRSRTLAWLREHAPWARKVPELVWRLRNRAMIGSK